MKINRIYIFAVVLLLSAASILSSCTSSEDEENVNAISSDDVFGVYEKLASLPRSGADYPKEINAYITEYAKGLGLKAGADKNGNLLVTIPATANFKTEASLIVQCSTSGAAGAADALAAADHIIDAEKNGGEHLGVKFMFIANGNNNGAGIKSISKKWLNNANLFVSLDGAGTSNAALSAEYAAVLESNVVLAPAENKTKYAYVISASGYPGGAFGRDNTSQNPLDALIEVLAAVNNSGILYELCSFEGGSDALTAPQEATAVISMNDYEQKRFAKLFNDAVKSLDAETGIVEITQTVIPEYAVSAEDAGKIITHLFSLSSSDFTEQNKKLSGVHTGRISLQPNSFVCDILIVGSDGATVEKVVGECSEIQVLSDIPLQRLDNLPGFETQADNAQVQNFIDAYGAAVNGKINTKKGLSISPLGFIREKFPELPILSIGVSIENEGTPEEQIDAKDLAKPANAILDYLSK